MQKLPNCYKYLKKWKVLFIIYIAAVQRQQGEDEKGNDMGELSKLVKNVKLTPLETNILSDMVSHMEEAKTLGIRGLALKHYTSTTTVIRLAKKLGYRGFTDMYYGISLQLDKHRPGVRAEVPFLNNFVSDIQKIASDYDGIRALARKLTEQRRDLVYICGMGFSSFPADYFTKKLMIQGIKCIFSGAEESIGIFENNLEDIGLFLAVSRSGETLKILERVHKAAEHGLMIASFTASRDSSLGKLSDIVISMEDNCRLDDKNEEPSGFFSGIMLQMELVILEMKKYRNAQAGKQNDPAPKIGG